MSLLETSLAVARCKWCKLPTTDILTYLCHGCWGLYTRIRMEPEIARKMLEEIEDKHGK